MLGFNPYIMIQNFQIIGTIMMTVCILLGIGLLVGAFFQFKRYAEVRGNFMAHQIPITGPVVMLICGSALLALPTVTGVLMMSLWGYSNPLSYGPGVGPMGDLMRAIVIFIRILGIASLIRGIIMMSRSGVQGHQPGTISKAFIHVIGGALLINIVGTWNMIRYIFLGA